MSYPVDSDLSGGERYPSFEQLGPDILDTGDALPKFTYHPADLVLKGIKKKKMTNLLSFNY